MHDLHLSLMRVLATGPLDIYRIDHELVRRISTPPAPADLRAALVHLLDQQLVTVTPTTVGRETYDVYSLTAAGHQHLRASRAHTLATPEMPQQGTIAQSWQEARTEIFDSDEMWLARFTFALRMRNVGTPHIVATLAEVRHECAVSNMTAWEHLGDPHDCAHSLEFQPEPAVLRGLHAIAVPTGVLGLLLSGAAALAAQRNHLAYVSVSLLTIFVLVSGWLAAFAWKPRWYRRYLGGPSLIPFNVARAGLALSVVGVFVLAITSWPTGVPSHIGFVPAWTAASAAAVLLALHVAVTLRLRSLLSAQFLALGIDRAQPPPDALTKKLQALPSPWTFPVTSVALCAMLVAIA